MRGIDGKASVACILGAGFSRMAKIPLARDLFRSDYVVAVSEASRKRFSSVREHFAEWNERNPNAHAEEYLDGLYNRTVGENAPLWAWAVQYISAVIASPGTPPESLNRDPRYSYRINRPLRMQAYSHFWKAIIDRTDHINVLTTNYDFLIEQTLRHRRMSRPLSPGCFYGGFPRPQKLKGAAQPFSRWAPENLIEMTGEIPLFKLHGSLNWVLNGDDVVMYQDARGVHRKGGEAAIVPPLPEKTIPTWLSGVWEEAEAVLRNSTVWIVCGYSMPAYDTKIIELLRNGAKEGGKSIILLSPNAKDLLHRWKSIAPNAEAIGLNGLPDGVPDLSHQLALIFQDSNRHQSLLPSRP
jgi:hypothetical protein